jgi:hypothetical protein
MAFAATAEGGRGGKGPGGGGGGAPVRPGVAARGRGLGRAYITPKYMALSRFIEPTDLNYAYYEIS